MEEFTGLSTFALPQALPPLLALCGRPGSPRLRDRLLGATALALAVSEGDPRLQPLTRLLGRAPSQNLVATIEPTERAERSLCLVSHLDSSRSGLLFHPGLAPHLRKLIDLTMVAFLLRSAALIGAGRPTPLAGLSRVATPLLLAGLALLLERELRGVDVPGANDNASGVAVAATIAAELAASPPRSTRVTFLATGCEESGTIGMRAFLESHDTDGWLFVNLDGVGAPATLRYLPREGVGRIWAADPGLVRIAEDLAASRPDLELKPAERVVGLTYDATQVLARGGRALTISAQDETIPNYHSPTDTAENLDPDVLRRATEVVRSLVAAVDRGEAD